jgi:hypothetical protein
LDREEEKNRKSKLQPFADIDDEGQKVENASSIDDLKHKSKKRYYLT